MLIRIAALELNCSVLEILRSAAERRQSLFLAAIRTKAVCMVDTVYNGGVRSNQNCDLLQII